MSGKNQEKSGNLKVDDKWQPSLEAEASSAVQNFCKVF